MTFTGETLYHAILGGYITLTKFLEETNLMPQLLPELKWLTTTENYLRQTRRVVRIPREFVDAIFRVILDLHPDNPHWDNPMSLFYEAYFNTTLAKCKLCLCMLRTKNREIRTAVQSTLDPAWMLTLQGFLYFSDRADIEELQSKWMPLWMHRHKLSSDEFQLKLEVLHPLLHSACLAEFRGSLFIMCQFMVDQCCSALLLLLCLDGLILETEARLCLDDSLHSGILARPRTAGNSAGDFHFHYQWIPRITTILNC